jgi:hypothetical protein
MTATAKQVRIFEAKAARRRAHWLETLNPQQAAFLEANADAVAHAERAVAEATSQGHRITEFAGLLDAYDTASQLNDPRSIAQAGFLLIQLVTAAPHILADLRHALAEAETAHRHYVAAVQDAHRDTRARLLAEDEVTRLKALVDQLQAAADAATV